MTSRREEIFLEVFGSLPRQGPGNVASARRALALCASLPRAAPTIKILDLGCGAGAQTLQLAALTAGTILAVDNYAPLIDQLQRAITERQLAPRIEARLAEISALELPAESVDLVWSEGALYNLGLAAAIPLCAGWLRPGGYLAFTEAVWLTAEPPPEVRAAFADYPTMGRVDDVLPIIEAAGLSLVDHFDLPEDAWWDDFYQPMERQIEELRAKYVGDAEALAALEEVAQEPAMRRRAGHHYGYTFFVAQLPLQGPDA